MDNLSDFVIETGDDASKVGAFGITIGAVVGFATAACDGGDKALDRATRWGSVGGKLGTVVGGTASMVHKTRKGLIKQRNEWRKTCLQNSLKDSNHLCVACPNLPNELWN